MYHCQEESLPLSDMKYGCQKMEVKKTPKAAGLLSLFLSLVRGGKIVKDLEDSEREADNFLDHKLGEGKMGRVSCVNRWSPSAQLGAWYIVGAKTTV